MAPEHAPICRLSIANKSGVFIPDAPMSDEDRLKYSFVAPLSALRSTFVQFWTMVLLPFRKFARKKLTEVPNGWPAAFRAINTQLEEVSGAKLLGELVAIQHRHHGIGGIGNVHALGLVTRRELNVRQHVELFRVVRVEGKRLQVVCLLIEITRSNCVVVGVFRRRPARRLPP